MDNYFSKDQKCTYCNGNVILRKNYPFGKKSKPRYSLWCREDNCGKLQLYDKKDLNKSRNLRKTRHKTLQEKLSSEMKKKANLEGHVKKKVEKGGRKKRH